MKKTKKLPKDEIASKMSISFIRKCRTIKIAQDEEMRLRKEAKIKLECCSDCGCDDIEWKRWADEFGNVNYTTSSWDDNTEVYCPNCEDLTNPISKKERKK